jgi:hypothetical protein
VDKQGHFPILPTALGAIKGVASYTAAKMDLNGYRRRKNPLIPLCQREKFLISGRVFSYLISRV